MRQSASLSNLYQVSKVLHPHLGLNIKEKKKGEQKAVIKGDQVNWQLRGLTEKVKRELDARQKEREKKKLEKVKKDQELLERAQKTASQILKRKTGVNFSLQEANKTSLKINLEEEPKSRGESIRKGSRDKSRIPMKFGNVRSPPPTERSASHKLKKISTLTPEEKIKELENQTRKCVQLMQSSSRKKHSYFNTIDSNTSDLKRYQIKGKVVGEGAFGVVRTAIQSTTGKWVAIKTYNKLKIVDKEKLRSIERECEVLQKISSPFVVKFIEKIENTRNIHLVMEFAGRQNLSKFLETKEGLNLKPNEIKILLKNISEGLKAIHSTGMVHRDLKLQNIVLNSYDSPKIVDFGFAREASIQMGICGTLNYMSPEIIEKVQPNSQPQKSDIWALGVMFYYVHCKKYPFTGTTEPEIKRNIKDGVPDFSSIESQICSDTIKNLLNKNPSERPTCEELLASPYFTHDY